MTTKSHVGLDLPGTSVGKSKRFLQRGQPKSLLFVTLNLGGKVLAMAESSEGPSGRKCQLGRRLREAEEAGFNRHSCLSRLGLSQLSVSGQGLCRVRGQPDL